MVHYLPVPVKITVCGLVGALSTKNRVPERIPVPFGLNLILILQLAPGFKVGPQVVADCGNSAELL